MNTPHTFLPLFYDFYLSYGAALLVNRGQNPYIVSSLQTVMDSFGWPPDERVWGFTHPPWVFWLYLPLALFSSLGASFVWLGVELISLGVVFRLIFQVQALIFPNFKLKPDLLFPLLITLLPILKTFIFGQISFLLLIGLLLYLIKEKQGQYLQAGLALSLTFLKPHLLVPFVAAVCFRALLQRKPTLLFGIALGFLAQNGISLLFCPQIYTQYFEYVPELVRNSPALNGATLVQLLAKVSSFPFYPVLVVLGILYGVRSAVCIKEEDQFRHLMSTRVLTLSLICSPYAFSHEFSLLVPALIPIFFRVTRLSSASRRILLLVNLAFSLSIITHTAYEPLAIIFPLALLVVYLSAIRYSLPSP